MKTIRKALVAAGGSAATALLAGLAAGLTDGHLTLSEGGTAVGLALAAAAAVGRTVWAVPNEDSPQGP